MNPELSRRVAKIMHTDVIIAMSLQERQVFVTAVDDARDFNFLSNAYKALIIKAEAELHGR